MMQLSSSHRIWTRPQGLYVYGRSPCAGLRGARRWQRSRTQGMVPLLLGALLLFVAAVFSQDVPPLEERSPVSQAVHPTPVVIVQADTLPPVMHRIAQCESRGQHWTTQGQVVRGKRNHHDLGLFQINTHVWGQKAQELGYDLYTPEDNTHMARYLFEHYGSVPWQSSAACWSHLS